MKTTTHKAFNIISLVTGLLLIFIGLRFFLVPEQAEAGFGIQTGPHTSFAFHYIKGARDFAVGLLTLVLLLNKEYRSLGWMMLCMGLVPTNDLLMVLNDLHHLISHTYAHIIAIIICFTAGPYYLYTTKKKVYAL
ncbi:MAG: DUF4267 domain-containing protein [Chitinophaga sp.]|uniref:DUF4267 domain-containing protein n=1 Tax=Chitinophaga sp. TaxID=1869181 RepID=UPI0025BE39C4|nr:DUF4267 domain-containing protein [Chitinophaga sp.]MBV8252382.1 DUF4267 domain-containing protein [Chitinophaga sp.]